jgi:hypothetical protein
MELETNQTPPSFKNVGENTSMTIFEMLKLANSEDPE